MPAELKINGLNELIQELRRLPPALVRDAAPPAPATPAPEPTPTPESEPV